MGIGLRWVLGLRVGEWETLFDLPCQIMNNSVINFNTIVNMDDVPIGLLDHKLTIMVITAFTTKYEWSLTGRSHQKL